MKKITIAAALALLGVFPVSAAAQMAPTFASQEDSISYAVGMKIVKSMREDSIALDFDLIAAGMKDAAAGKQRLSDSAMEELLTLYERQMMARYQDGMREDGESGMIMDSVVSATEQAREFMEENGRRKEVVTLPSGLQYEVLKKGRGKRPKESDRVKVRYRVTLIDGTVVDTTHDPEGVIQPVGGMIPGWTEALKLMPTGSAWRVYIPAELGQGNDGGGFLPPGALMIYEIELLEIVRK